MGILNGKAKLVMKRQDAVTPTCWRSDVVDERTATVIALVDRTNAISASFP